LEFLDATLKTTLFTLSMINLGIVRVRRERTVSGAEVIARVNVECYCEEMTFVAGEESVGSDAPAAAPSSSAPDGTAPPATGSPLVSLTDTLVGIISGRIKGEDATRAALEIARSPTLLTPSTAAVSEIVARRLLTTIQVPDPAPPVPKRADGTAIGEKWATGRATLEELKNVAALESSDWSALRLDVDHTLIAELRVAGLVPASENGPIELERNDFVEGIVAGASGVMRNAEPHLGATDPGKA
jgi:hypothetical protein